MNTDIGIFRLQEDIKSAIPEVQKHFTDKQIEVNDVYTDVVSSFWRSTYILPSQLWLNKDGCNQAKCKSYFLREMHEFAMYKCFNSSIYQKQACRFSSITSLSQVFQ